MRTAVVFYSLTGNTAMAAGHIAAALGADLIELKPVKSYPDKGFRKFFWGGKSAVMAEAPALEPIQFCAADYDSIVFGFPVWAGTIAPPVRSFIAVHRAELAGKQISSFACQSGAGAAKAFRKLEECLGMGPLRAELVLIDPADKPDPANEEKIRAFCEKC